MVAPLVQSPVQPRSSMDNKRAADTLSLLGDLIELVEDASFKARAYHGAARTLKSLEQPASDLVEQDTLGTLPGFGKAMVEKVSELFTTGQIKYLQDLVATVPAGVIQMRKISGLGAKKIRMLYREHQIESLEALSQAAEDGSLEALPGFGAKSVARIADGISQIRSFEGKLRLPEANLISNSVCEILAESFGSEHVAVAGDLRRSMPIVEGLRWVVEGSTPSEALMASLGDIPECEGVEFDGSDVLTIRFSDSVMGSVRFVAAEEFGRAQLSVTGPETFATRVIADAGTQSGSEAELMQRAGLGIVPPECRDSESLWAEESRTNLISDDHLKGVLHCHTNHSDGMASLEEMAKAAKDRGLEYIGICDHSPSAAYAGGLTPDRVARQHEEIDTLNAAFDDGFRILKGTESDIRTDGSLDFSDDVLASFDFVVASIHSQLDMDEDAATERICRALENPFTTILGHATARLLLKRRGYPLDWPRVIETAATHGVVIELNANPRRLEIDWTLLPALFAAGVMTSINPDAHSTAGIDDMKYGVCVARKAGTTPDRVLNCMELSEIVQYFDSRKN